MRNRSRLLIGNVSILWMLATSCMVVSANPLQLKPSVIDPKYKIIQVAPDTHFAGFNGITAGPDGALYGTHVCDGSITRIDPKTRKSVTYAPSYIGTFYPDDIASDNQGNFYITRMSPLVGEVYCIDRNLQKTTIAKGLKAPNGIRYNERTGRLFMSECFHGNRVFELDPAGVNEPRLLEKAKMIVPEGFDFDPDTDDLIIPDMGMGKIYRVKPDSGQMTKIASGFQKPVALKVGPDKMVYFPEMISGALYRLSLDGQKKEKIAQLPPGLDNLAFTRDGHLYVTNWWDATVYEVATDGSGKFKSLFPTGNSMILGLVFKNGKIWAADNIMIRGLEKGKFIKTKLNPSRDNMPIPVALSNGPGEQILWAEPFSGAIAMGNPATREFTLIASGLKPLNQPTAIAMSKDELKAYVTEYGSGKITEVELVPDGAKKTVAAGFEGPVGLARIGDALYVAEGKAARISKVNLSTGKTEVFIVGVGKIGGLADDGFGNLLALELGGGRLFRINPKNLALDIIAVNLPVGYMMLGSCPGLELVSSIAVNQKGDIYMPTSGRGLIRLERKE